MLRSAASLLILPLLGACLSGAGSLHASATLEAGGAGLGVGAEVEAQGPAALALAGGALLAAAGQAAAEAELAGPGTAAAATSPEATAPLRASSFRETETSVTSVETQSAATVETQATVDTTVEAQATVDTTVEAQATVDTTVEVQATVDTTVETQATVDTTVETQAAVDTTVEAARGASRRAHVGVGSVAAPAGPSGTVESAPFVLGELSFAASASAASGAELAAVMETGAGAATAEARVRAARGEGAASLGALLGAGVRVDGALVRVADLGPLASSAATPAAAGVAAGSGLRAEAWVEAQGAGQALVIRLASPAATPRPPRAPVRLTLVVDQSESMQRRWADVVVLAEAMLATLAPTDEVQVVGVATGGTVLRPMAPLGDGASVRAALRAGDVGGGTNLEAGLALAWAAGTPGVRSRVVVLSDGVPNEGAFLPEELAPRAAAALAETGCTTTVVGLGSQFDAPLLRALADAGGGGYHVGAGARIAPALAGELRAALRAPSEGAYVELALPPGVEAAAGGAFAVEGRVARASLPALAPGAERRLVLPLAGRPAAALRVYVGWKGPLGAQGVTLAAPAVAVETPASADAVLGIALDAAAGHVAAGRGRQAREALRLVAESALASPVPAVRARAETTLRLGVALEALAPGASHGTRRELGLALGTLGWQLRR